MSSRARVGLEYSRSGFRWQVKLNYTAFRALRFADRWQFVQESHLDHFEDSRQGDVLIGDGQQHAVRLSLAALATDGVGAVGDRLFFHRFAASVDRVPLLPLELGVRDRVELRVVDEARTMPGAAMLRKYKC